MIIHVMIDNNSINSSINKLYNQFFKDFFGFHYVVPTDRTRRIITHPRVDTRLAKTVTTIDHNVTWLIQTYTARFIII